MQLSKQTEIASRLRDALLSNNHIINSYGDTWMLLENLKCPDIFIYLQIGDWAAPHTGTVYAKVNCFEKKQLTYSEELGCGENIEYLVDFANNPTLKNCVRGETNNQRVYLSNLYTVHTDGRTKWQVLNAELTNDKQKEIMKNLQHVEMIQKEIRRGIKREDSLHTILRFMGKNSYFDYDCEDEKIIGDGHIVVQKLDDLEDVYAYAKADLENIVELQKQQGILVDEFDFLKHDEKFRHQLLDRFRTDCEYYLGNGCKYAGCLWAKDETKQIQTMRLLHNSFADNKKPEWLTLEQIDKYEKEMCVQKIDKKEGVNIMDEKIEKLKTELFMNGNEAIEDFLGYEPTTDDKDSLDQTMSDVAAQMPEEELNKFFEKYDIK